MGRTGTGTAGVSGTSLTATKLLALLKPGPVEHPVFWLVNHERAGIGHNGSDNIVSRSGDCHSGGGGGGGGGR